VIAQRPEASAIVVIVTLVASYALAYRPSRLNPLTAVRHERSGEKPGSNGDKV
jgi:hypothetical protein